MKPTSYVIALSLLFPWMGLPASLSASEAPRTIQVRGDAEVKVEPDEVLITLGVETHHKDLTTATALNDEAMSRVLEVIRQAGVPDKHVRTDYLNIEPRYRDRYEAQDFLGYWVRKSVVVTLRDVGAFESLLARVLESGVNYVHGIDFRTTELRKHRDRARDMALKAAREKARRMAAALDARIGDPVTIVEDYAGWWSWYGSGWGARYGGMMQNVAQDASGGRAGGSVAPGQIAVTARVSVTFELQ